MDEKSQAFILELMRTHNILTLATLRPDGYPQATTVAYVNDGLNLYFGTAKDSQKVRNIRRTNKVSLTIDRDYADWRQIKGLSMAATAEVLAAPDEIELAVRRLMEKFPILANLPELADPADVAIVRIRPLLVSVLNYERQFGHVELVEV